jgi:uncharacterized RDD family membrane protein YckC
VTDLVTGEAVVLELRVARLASRALALLIDLVVQIALLVAGIVLLDQLLLSLDSAAGATLSLVWTVSIIVGYPVLFETLSRGRSLGKLALGLRVVRDDGGPIRFRQALMRALVGFFVDIWTTFGSVALVSSLASKRAKRLGDVAAGTLVVHERVPHQSGPVAVMPPGLAGWASTLELSRLPDDLALAARQYLARSSGFDPAASQVMGERLAGAVASYVSPPPPPGVPPWAYLSAVLAERRTRESARLARAGTYGVPPTHSAPQGVQPSSAAPPASAPSPPSPAPSPAPTPDAEHRDDDGFVLPS